MSDAKAYDDLTLLNGGVILTARFTGGASEEVRVGFVPIKAMPQYLEALEDEARVIELCCNKPKGWAEKLHPASHNELITKAEELNRPLFDAWFRRRESRLDLLNPGRREKVEALIADSIRQAIEKKVATSDSAKSVSSSQPEPDSVSTS